MEEFPFTFEKGLLTRIQNSIFCKLSGHSLSWIDKDNFMLLAKLTPQTMRKEFRINYSLHKLLSITHKFL